MLLTYLTRAHLVFSVSLLVGCGAGVSAPAGAGGSGGHRAYANAPGGAGASNGGSAGIDGGTACTGDGDCAKREFCRFVRTACNDGGTPRVVVFSAAGTCRSLTAPCQHDDDCPSYSACDYGTCTPFTDKCTVMRACPNGCPWNTGRCACVCNTCP